MEIKISSKHILLFLNVIAWMIFVGICIQAGAFITTAVFTMLYTPAGALHLWQAVDLSTLYKFDPGYFIVAYIFMIIVAVLKALLFYLIIRVLQENKLNMKQPFNPEVGRFIFNVGYITLGIGIFSNWGAKYSKWFVQQGVKMPAVEDLELGGADVWLFMSVTLFVIAHIFKRGIEIQAENELTI